MDVKRLVKYLKCIDEVFDKPPGDASDTVFDIFVDYPSQIVAIDDKSYCMLNYLFDDIVYINWVVTDKKFQGKGYGKKLIEKVVGLNPDRMLITMTHNAKEFYEKFGFKEWFVKGEKTYMYRWCGK